MEGDAELQDLYREVLLDYYQSSARKGRLVPADLKAHGVNPVCGDEIEITAQIKDGKVVKLRYAGHGCVISQASAAMMAEAMEGAGIERVKELSAAFKRLMLENAPAAGLPPELESLASLEGVRKFPLRVKCATLGWNTMMQGLETGTGAED
ncbi:MAG: Fe-S cluster assembly sulfur transfer protein SufU [Elusimicrobiota bacterium]